MKPKSISTLLLVGAVTAIILAGCGPKAPTEAEVQNVKAQQAQSETEHQQQAQGTDHNPQTTGVK